MTTKVPIIVELLDDDDDEAEKNKANQSKKENKDFPRTAEKKEDDFDWEKWQKEEDTSIQSNSTNQQGTRTSSRRQKKKTHDESDFEYDENEESQQSQDSDILNPSPSKRKRNTNNNLKNNDHYSAIENNETSPSKKQKKTNSTTTTTTTSSSPSKPTNLTKKTSTTSTTKKNEKKKEKEEETWEEWPEDTWLLDTAINNSKPILKSESNNNNNVKNENSDSNLSVGLPRSNNSWSSVVSSENLALSEKQNNNNNSNNNLLNASSSGNILIPIKQNQIQSQVQSQIKSKPKNVIDLTDWDDSPQKQPNQIVNDDQTLPLSPVRNDHDVLEETPLERKSKSNANNNSNNNSNNVNNNLNDSPPPPSNKIPIVIEESPILMNQLYRSSKPKEVVILAGLDDETQPMDDLSHDTIPLSQNKPYISSHDTIPLSQNRVVESNDTIPLEIHSHSHSNNSNKSKPSVSSKSTPSSMNSDDMMSLDDNYDGYYQKDYQGLNLHQDLERPENLQSKHLQNRFNKPSKPSSPTKQQNTTSTTTTTTTNTSKQNEESKKAPTKTFDLTNDFGEEEGVGDFLSQSSRSQSLQSSSVPSSSLDESIDVDTDLPRMFAKNKTNYLKQIDFEKQTALKQKEQRKQDRVDKKQQKELDKQNKQKQKERKKKRAEHAKERKRIYNWIWRRRDQAEYLQEIEILIDKRISEESSNGSEIPINLRNQGAQVKSDANLQIPHSIEWRRLFDLRSVLGAQLKELSDSDDDSDSSGDEKEGAEGKEEKQSAKQHDLEMSAVLSTEDNSLKVVLIRILAHELKAMLLDKENPDRLIKTISNHRSIHEGKRLIYVFEGMESFIRQSKNQATKQLREGGEIDFILSRSDLDQLIVWFETDAKAQTYETKNIKETVLYILNLTTAISVAQFQ